MAVNFLGEWDGVCACGKKEADGKRCIFGATHKPLSGPVFPWTAAAPKPESKMPWEVN